MGKRLLRAAAVLFLLLLVEVVAGQDFKRGMAEEYGEVDSPVKPEGSEEPGQGGNMSVQDETVQDVAGAGKIGQTGNDGGDTEDGLICGDYRYEIVHGENTVRILAYLGDEEIVFVPEKLNGMEVSVIGSGAFAGQSVMEEVLLPTGVTKIEKEAFAYCSRLQYIIMGDQISSIETEAFAYCPSLEEIRFPEGLETTGARICAYCPRLEKIYLTMDMEKMEYRDFYRAFEGCSGLKLVYGNSPYAEMYAEVLGLVYVDLNRIEEEGNLAW